MTSVHRCTGCGRNLDNPIPKTAIACCPDSNYKEVNFFLHTYNKETILQDEIESKNLDSLLHMAKVWLKSDERNAITIGECE